MKNKVTIITTPHSDERHPYLKRFLSYYAQFEFFPTIIVADSSPTPITDTKILHYINLLNVKYIKYPHSLHIKDKLVEILEFITTPYCLICPEDDIVTIKGISEAVNILDEDHVSVLVSGFSLAYILLDGDVKISHSYLPQEISDIDIEKTLGYFISKYPYVLYSSIYRVEIFKKIWLLRKNNTNDLEFGELLPAFLSPIYGNLAVIKSLFVVRSYFHDSSGQSNKSYRMMDMVDDNSYIKRYNQFKECMVKEINNNSDLDSKEAEKLVDKSFGKYFTERFGCNYLQLRRKILLKKILKKTGVFSFAKRLKSKIKPNPVIVSQEQNYEDDPLFPKDEWDEMKMFLENNIISQ